MCDAGSEAPPMSERRSRKTTTVKVEVSWGSYREDESCEPFWFELNVFRSVFAKRLDGSSSLRASFHRLASKYASFARVVSYGMSTGSVRPSP